MTLVDVAYWIRRSLSEKIKAKVNYQYLEHSPLLFTFIPDDLYVNNSIILSMILCHNIQ